MYLFGWPVEQLVKRYSDTDNPWLLMSLALPLVVTLAAVSCHWIEQPALRLKRPLAAWLLGLLMIHDPRRRHAVRIGATLTFLAAAAAILLHGSRWWYVTRSIAEVSVAGAIGAVLPLIGARALQAWRRLTG
jgi:peptidoglycan/LPS O-acetylase OafA/YrhL